MPSVGHIIGNRGVNYSNYICAHPRTCSITHPTHVTVTTEFSDGSIRCIWRAAQKFGARPVKGSSERGGIP